MITKHLIWNEIRTLEMVMELAINHGLEHHPFVDSLFRLKVKFEEDLIKETDKEQS